MKKVIFNCGELNDLEKDLINILNRKKIKYYYYSCIKELNIKKKKLYFLIIKYIIIKMIINYIDLLLFNYEYNCFVVVELKITELNIIKYCSDERIISREYELVCKWS